MKKIAFFNAMFLFVLIFVGLFATKIFDNKSIFNLCQNYQKVTIVSHQNIDCSAEKISNGNLNYYTFNSQNLPQQNYNVEGIVFYFSPQTSIKYFQKLFKSSFTKSTSIQGREVYYGFHTDFNKYVVHKNKKVNAQLAQTSEGWILGFPLILTGF